MSEFGKSIHLVPMMLSSVTISFSLQLKLLILLQHRPGYQYFTTQQHNFHQIQDPDHTKPFHVYPDASEYQLGAVIMQEEPLLHIILANSTAELHVYAAHRTPTYSNLQQMAMIVFILPLKRKSSLTASQNTQVHMIPRIH